MERDPGRWRDRMEEEMEPCSPVSSYLFFDGRSEGIPTENVTEECVQRTLDASTEDGSVVTRMNKSSPTNWREPRRRRLSSFSLPLTTSVPGRPSLTGSKKQPPRNWIVEYQIFARVSRGSFTFDACEWSEDQLIGLGRCSTVSKECSAESDVGETQRPVQERRASTGASTSGRFSSGHRASGVDHEPTHQSLARAGTPHSLGVFTCDRSAYLSDDEFIGKRRLKVKKGESAPVRKDRTVKYDKPVEKLERVLCYKVIDGNNIMIEAIPSELPILAGTLFASYRKQLSDGRNTAEVEAQLSELGYFPLRNEMLARRLRVRLRTSFAPRRRQKYALPAKRALEELVLRQWLDVYIYGRDRHGRALADCVLHGDDVNVDEEMIKSGFAWQNVPMVQELSLSQLQKQAQRERKGLWAQKRPTPPWA